MKVSVSWMTVISSTLIALIPQICLLARLNLDQATGRIVQIKLDFIPFKF